MPHFYSSNGFGCQHKLERPLGCSSLYFVSYAQSPDYFAFQILCWPRGPCVLEIDQEHNNLCYGLGILQMNILGQRDFLAGYQRTILLRKDRTPAACPFISSRRKVNFFSHIKPLHNIYHSSSGAHASVFTCSMRVLVWFECYSGYLLKFQSLLNI